MRFQRSDIFASKNKNSLIHTQNSSIFYPIQSRYVKIDQQSDSFKVFIYKADTQILKQSVYNRINLAIEYVPEFMMVSQTSENITIKIKQYTLELLPWLIKKDPLFKVNIVLGIYVAFLELIDMYGLFPLHPNMMKVNQKQQVAVWINKNFQSLEPDQVLTRNAFSIRQFIKSFLRIFKCCLPNKRMSDMYNDPKQLLGQLTTIKRKEQMHKNCHQFIRHQNTLNSSRKSNKFQSTSIIQSLKQIPQKQRYSTKPNFSVGKSPKIQKCRFSSFSPPKRSEKIIKSKQKINQTTGFKNRPSFIFNPDNFKKKTSIVQTINNQQTRTDQRTYMSKKGSICSTGQLFKRYLMFSTSKFHKMSKIGSPQIFSCSSQQNLPRDFIFRSEVYKQNHNNFSQTIIEQRNSVQVMSQQLLNIDDSPIKFRKMSSNTNERKRDEQGNKKFMKTAGWKKSFKEQDNFQFTPTEHQDQSKLQPQQKLKNSFPYKTASTLTSFRLSNHNQYHIFPSKSQQNLNACSNQSLSPLNHKQKDKKIEQMKIVQQNQLQNDFNNIFSMQNSNVRKQEEQKRLEKIITEFQQVLF